MGKEKKLSSKFRNRKAKFLTATSGGRVEVGDLSHRRNKNGKHQTKDATNSEYDGVAADLVFSDGENTSDEDEPSSQKPVNGFGKTLTKGTVYYRCNIRTAVRELEAVNLREEHYELLKCTPFYAFVKALKEIDISLLILILEKKDEAIRLVMSRYNKPTGHFMMGGKVLKPMRRDVELTFGILNGKVPLPLKKGEAASMKPQWFLRCFKVPARKPNWKFSKKTIIEKLVELCDKDGRENVADVVRLVHCYVLGCVFAPKQNTSISMHMASFAEDISKMKTYDWAGYILRLLFSQMNETTNMKSGGCAMFLLYWLCEHVALIEPSVATELQFPRLLRWDLRELYAYMARHGLGKLSATMVSVEKLDLTPEEAGFFKEMMRHKCVTSSVKHPKPSLRKLLKMKHGGVSMSRSGGSRTLRFNRTIKRHSSKVVVSESGSDSDNDSCDVGFVELRGQVQSGYTTPPHSGGGNCLSDDEMARTPNTSEFMDNLDSDGVPKGGGRPTTLHHTNTPCCQLFLEDKEPLRNSNEARLQLLIKTKDVQILNLREVSIAQCTSHRDEIITMRGEACKTKAAVVELKAETEKVLGRVTSECTKLAQEYNRLKGIVSQVKTEKVQLLNEKVALGNNVDQLSSEKLQLLNEKVSLGNMVALLNSEKVELKRQLLEVQDKMADASSAGAVYVLGLEKRYDDLVTRYTDLQGTSRSQLNEGKAWLIKKDNKITELTNMVNERDGIIRNLRKELNFATGKIQDLKNAEPIDIFDHPEVLEHIECVELLHDASKVISEMGAEIEESDRKLEEQAVMIERMQLVPYSPTVAVPCANKAPAGSPVGICNFEIGEGSGSALLCKKKRSRLTVSPGSITRAIKQRTQARCRVPRKLSDQWLGPNTINISDGEEDVASVQPVLPIPPFPILDSKFWAVRKSKKEILDIFRECWETGGPRFELIDAGPYGIAVVTAERCVGLLHHESIDDCMIDGWALTLKRLLKNYKGLVDIFIFPARVFGLITNDPKSVHLVKWVDNEMATALKSQVMLFPINAPASLASTAAHGCHWTLLRYNVSSHQWFFYNSMPCAVGRSPDIYRDQAYKVVLYVEEVMKKVYSKTNPQHAMLQPGYFTAEPTKVDTCMQDPGSLDCGVIVCLLIELFLKGKPVKRGGYTTLMAGMYRQKMLEWFVDPASATNSR